jgi:hypothetical protein
MKIMLAGSFSFAQEIVQVKKRLDVMGHTVFTTRDLELFAQSPRIKTNFDEELKHCIEYDSMREGFNLVVASDVVVVCNYQKNDIRGYLGTSVLMEIAIAYQLAKKVYFLYDYDRSQSYGLEVAIINPIIIDDDLSKIVEDGV